MNKRTSTYAVTVFLVLLLPSLVHPSPIVRLEPPSATILHGGMFALNLFVDLNDSDSEIFAFGFDVCFDSSQFTIGPAFVAAPFEEISWPETDVVGTAFPGVGGDNILLAVLNFKALLPGNFSIGIFSDLTESSEGLRIWSDTEKLFDLTATTTVTVRPVPAPPTLWLLASGLAALAGLSRRHKADMVNHRRVQN